MSVLIEAKAAVVPDWHDTPLYQSRIHAGFPSPADDFIEARLDLNRHLIHRPEATFFLRVAGDSMRGAGIHSGDLLIVDRSVTPVPGRVIIALVDGELTVKRLGEQNGEVLLMAENRNYPPLRIRDGMDFSVWGVVRHVIHAV